jgi:hypothetical protein
VSSAYHIELNPSDVGYSDRLLVQAVIKEIAGSRPLLSSAGSFGSRCGLSCIEATFVRYYVHYTFNGRVCGVESVSAKSERARCLASGASVWKRRAEQPRLLR